MAVIKRKHQVTHDEPAQVKRSTRKQKWKPRIVAVKVETPVILLDDREGSKQLINHAPLNECGQLCRLDSGDACFPGNGPGGDVLVGVEVKSILDLISSMNTGRLNGTQIPAMKQQYDVVWLLVYRDYTVGPNGELMVATGKEFLPYFIGSKPVPYGEIEARLVTIAEAGVHVKCVKDDVEAAWWLGVLARRYARPYKSHKSLQVFDRSRSVSAQPLDAELRDPVTLMMAEMASHLPAMGYVRAVAAARHFASPMQMFEATEEEWAQVPGVGKVVAREVVQALWKSKAGNKGRNGR